MADIVCYPGFTGVRLLNSFVLAGCSFPVTGFSKSTCIGFTGFKVGRVKSQSALTVGERGFVVFEL